jgi:hypothetical protein
MQRYPAADVDACICAAHAAALDVKCPPEPGAAFFLPAGCGGFVATLEVTRDRDTGGTVMVHAQCQTW